MTPTFPNVPTLLLSAFFIASASALKGSDFDEDDLTIDGSGNKIGKPLRSRDFRLARQLDKLDLRHLEISTAAFPIRSYKPRLPGEDQATPSGESLSEFAQEIRSSRRGRGKSSSEEMEEEEEEELGGGSDEALDSDSSDPDYVPSDERRRRRKRAAYRNPYHRWSGGGVPYALSRRYGRLGRALIAYGILRLEETSCVRWRPRRSGESDFVLIGVGEGDDEEACWADIGRIGGRQDLTLSYGCLDKGTIIHEMMHTLGFFHEHARADRDDWVTVHMENVAAGEEDQFEKLPLSEITHLDTPYDLSSIMHYDSRAFSGNGRETLTPKFRPAKALMGQEVDLSPSDVWRLNKLYCQPKRGRKERRRRPVTK